MSEMKPVTVERAREALEDMDDYARMDVGVDAQGPRETLERFIADHEHVVAELRMRAERAEVPESLHWYSRRGAMKGFGNAIVPQVAAEVIRAFMDCMPAPVRTTAMPFHQELPNDHQG